MIENNQILKLNNLLSFRKKINQSDIQKEMDNIEVFIKENKLSIVGPKISSIRSISGKNDDIVNIEILVPIDKEFNKTDDYRFKKSLKLSDCLKLTCEGTLEDLNNAFVSLEDYIEDNNLSTTSNHYTITTKLNQEGLFHVSAYVSVAPKK